MYMRREVLALLTLLGWASGALAEDSESPVFEGRVVNATSAHPVEGAFVVVLSQLPDARFGAICEHDGVVSTDNAGAFRLPGVGGHNSRVRPRTVVIYKPGYAQEPSDTGDFLLREIPPDNQYLRYLARLSAAVNCSSPNGRSQDLAEFRQMLYEDARRIEPLDAVGQRLVESLRDRVWWEEAR
ncbi:MAG TPA: hypothetical protein DIW43_01695 [Spongiibacteraceae bacterium]|nr:hypothetical protein [Spongiibacteraceae bacterium]HCS26135.1 hypothetical protein [Spongiibacteraceae bacterium]